MWSETVVTRLAALRPGRLQAWADLEPDARAAQLTAALKPYGVRTGQVWGTTDDGKGANRRGITRDDITTAITQRNQKAGSGRGHLTAGGPLGLAPSPARPSTPASTRHLVPGLRTSR